jgi:hypothetical protein
MAGKPQLDRTKLVPLICERLSKGEPLAQICRDAGMPDPSTVWDWCEADKSIAQQITRARNNGYDQIALDALAIADDASSDYMKDPASGRKVLNSEHVQRSKLRIHTRMQLLAKWDPKRYGDNVQLRHANAEGDGDASVTVKSALLDGLQSAMAKGKKPKA